MYSAANLMQFPGCINSHIVPFLYVTNVVHCISEIDTKKYAYRTELQGAELAIQAGVPASRLGTALWRFTIELG